MSPETVLGLGQQALLTILYIAGPLLAAGLIVGLVIGILQAVTSVQDQTLTYMPKLLAVFAVLLVLLPWMVTRMVGYASKLLSNLASFGH